MRAFFYILQTCANSTTIRYPDEPLKFDMDKITKNADKNKQKDYDFIKVCYVYNIVCKIYKEFQEIQKTKNKNKNKNKQVAYAKLKVFSQIFYNVNNQANPPFFLNSYKTALLETFTKAQRIYNAFARLAHIYRVKKYKTVVTDDLSMNPLDIKHPNTFVLIQNKSKYLFNTNDLVKIVENAITHAPSFFQEPTEAKNPYNNEPFNLSTLYNIYFKLKVLPRIMPTLIHLFFLSNFNVDYFVLNNEPLLRETAIRKYIHNSTDDILYKSIMKMLAANYYTRKLIIHKEFPIKTLIEIFKPFLYYFYIINYDIQGTQRIDNYKETLYIKLKKFYEYNKAFGRKMCRATFKNKLLKRLNLPLISQTYFSTEHISFHNITIQKSDMTDIHVLLYGIQSEEDDLSDSETQVEESEVEESEVEESEVEESEEDDEYLDDDDDLADISIS
jgi:hypothetical protein